MQERLWIRRILSGDKAAGERFVTDHYPRIYRMLRYLTGSADSAEDLAQQTFLKAWQALVRANTSAGSPEVDDPGKWLTRIAINTCLDRLRSTTVRWRRRIRGEGCSPSRR